MIQPKYNLVKRQAEVEILPLAVSEQIGVISYSHLGAGLLTGKYGVNKRPEQGRLVEEKRYTDRYADEMNFVVADCFTAYAAEQGLHPATLAIAWVMSNPTITAPIIGARNVERLEYSLAAVDVDMTPEWRNEISSLSVNPAPATDRGEVLLPIRDLVRNAPILISGRFIQGLACGLASSTVTAYVVDNAPASPNWLGATVTSGAPNLGLAIGAFGFGALKQYGTGSSSLTFGILIVILVGCAVLIAISQETVARTRGTARSTLPQIRVPQNIRHLLPVASCIFVGT